MSLHPEVGLRCTAGLLGVTYGIPEHVRSVAALPHEAGSARLSALAGACSAAGHVAFVVLRVGLDLLTERLPAVLSG